MMISIIPRGYIAISKRARRYVPLISNMEITITQKDNLVPLVVNIVANTTRKYIGPPSNNGRVHGLRLPSMTRLQRPQLRTLPDGHNRMRDGHINGQLRSLEDIDAF
jgi:hypothetical protein